jgi:hypothetical protein
VVSGIVTVVEVCKELGITKPTYYRRLKQIEAAEEHNIQVRNNVTLTLEELDSKARMVMSKLEEMVNKGTGYNTEKHDTLDVLKTMIQLLSALKKTPITIDNRTTNVTVNVDSEALEKIWLEYVDPVFRRLGVSDEIIEKASEIVDAEFKEVKE